MQPTESESLTGTPSQDDVLSAHAERNLAVSASLRETAWELTAAGLRAFRPELDEEQVQAEVRTIFRRAAG